MSDYVKKRAIRYKLKTQEIQDFEKLLIDDDSEYTVEFISSMDDVVSVDEMGYIKGLKNTDVPTTITVKLNYLGETFTDTCIVYVSVKEAF